MEIDWKFCEMSCESTDELLKRTERFEGFEDLAEVKDLKDERLAAILSIFPDSKCL